MQIEFPDLGLSEQEVKQELALSLYQQEKVSLAQATAVAGMTRIAFQQLLASRDIAIHYDTGMLDEDIRNLQKLGRLP